MILKFSSTNQGKHLAGIYIFDVKEDRGARKSEENHVTYSSTYDFGENLIVHAFIFKPML